jgi:hypothetical protein
MLAASESPRTSMTTRLEYLKKNIAAWPVEHEPPPMM